MKTPGKYVEFVGIAHAPGPLHIEDVTMWAHPFPAKREALTRLLDRVFAQTTGGDVSCVPFARVLVTFTRLGKICSTVPGYSAMGYNHESNVAFWVPTRVKVRDEDERFAMFLAGMWVSDPIALVAGREVWGYPKHLGEIELPADSGAGATLDGWAWQFDENSSPGKHRLVSLSAAKSGDPDVASDGADAEEPGTVATLEQAARHLVPHLLDEEDRRELLLPGPVAWRMDALECLTRKQMPQLFLRQFRDPHFGTAPGQEHPPAQGELPWGAADHQQAIVSMAKIAEPLRMRALPGRRTLKIEPFASHPIERDLGLGDEPSSLVGLRLDMNFDIELGQIVWSLRDGT